MSQSRREFLTSTLSSCAVAPVVAGVAAATIQSQAFAEDKASKPATSKTAPAKAAEAKKKAPSAQLIKTTDPLAKRLPAYVLDASKAASRKQADANCANCAFYKPHSEKVEGVDAGACTLAMAAGKYVPAAGYCAIWALNPKAKKS